MPADKRLALCAPWSYTTQSYMILRLPARDKRAGADTPYNKQRLNRTARLSQETRFHVGIEDS